jgi:release factor glutamine methyltransferase
MYSFAKLNQFLMNYRQLYTSFKKQLAETYDVSELDSMFFLALEKFSGMKKIDFFMDENQLVKSEVGDRFQEVIEGLTCSKPIQHILGEAWFNEHKYCVNEHVLIPRSETEELIKLVKERRPEAQSIIDLGTGSGCIAIELSLLYVQKVMAIDVSESALEVAQKNAQQLNADVSFIHADLLDESLTFNRKFDIIVSNPPYVMDAEKKLMDKNVLNYEPEAALFVPDDDPLVFYRAIRSFAIKHANHGALIAMEINEQLGQETAVLFENLFVDVLIHRDIHSKDRFVTAIYEGE